MGACKDGKVHMFSPNSSLDIKKRPTTNAMSHSDTCSQSTLNAANHYTGKLRKKLL